MAEKTPLRLACEGYAECIGSCPYDIHLYEPWAESCYEKCSAIIDYAECWERYFMQKSEKGHLMYINNPIEKLRAWVRVTREDGLGPLGTNLKELEEITDMIEAEFEARREASAFFEAERDRLYKVLADMKRTHMKLPVDADGAPIRPGDVVCYFDDGNKMHVTSVTEDGIYYEFEGNRSRQNPLPTNVVHHYVPDTVEDLMEKALEEAAMLDRYDGYCPSAADVTVIADKYAARIRKAVHDGD